MRAIFLPMLASIVVGCTSAPVVTPREYLDEQTAATITVVAEPWTFNRQGTTPQLDFVNLYAIDVNRMGDHRKYLVVVHYWPAPEWKAASPTLEISAGEELLSFRPVESQPRALGIGQAVDPGAPRSSSSWFYSIDDVALRTLARNAGLALALVKDETRADYTVWRNGSAELSEFATVALD